MVSVAMLKFYSFILSLMSLRYDFLKKKKPKNHLIIYLLSLLKKPSVTSIRRQYSIVFEDMERRHFVVFET